MMVERILQELTRDHGTTRDATSNRKVLVGATGIALDPVLPKVALSNHSLPSNWTAVITCSRMLKAFRQVHFQEAVCAER